MHQAIPCGGSSTTTAFPRQYGNAAADCAPNLLYLHKPDVPVDGEKPSDRAKMQDALAENAVIVVGKRGCCMSHVVKRLLLAHGVNPAAYEVGEEDEGCIVGELERIAGDRVGAVQFPTVFIGGRLFGGLDRVMAAHITGELVPILKEAGALWL